MRSLRVMLGVLVAAVLVAGAVQADEVNDAIFKANKAYNEQDYKEASTQLQTALVQVNQKLIEKLQAALPKPPSGWKAEDAEGIDASAIGAGFFATLVVTRAYTAPDGSIIELTISANSPLLMSLRMFASNPMIASMGGQGGMKKVEMCGYDAIEHFQEGTYELHVLGGNATLISFDGSDESDIPHIRALANATDCKAIVEIVE